jgi:NAD(P)-dependent dehydrogenase (short-subunit alcohol dehydrogenase family)
VGILDGKVAVITGAGSGMGKATAKIFAREGAKLIICDVSGAEEQTAAEIGGSDVVVLRCDVSKEDQVEATIATAVAKYGRLDSMLNVAGIGVGGTLESFEEAELDRIFSINFKGVFFGSKHAVRAMKGTGGGTILNWASLAGLIPGIGTVGYGASKASVIHLTKTIAVEYGAANIRANALCPGVITTEGMGAASAATTPGKASRNPLGRAGTPEDAGELAAFLASDKATYLSGVIIPLDGGWSCKMA